MLPWSERWQEGFYLFARRYIHLLIRMRQDETIHTDHDRDRHLFGYAEGLDMQINCLLVVLCIELQPTTVTLRHGIAVIVPDVDWTADCAVGDRHDDRQSQARCVVNGFHHV